MVSRYAEGIKDVPGLDVEAAVAKIERMVEERVREGEDPGFFCKYSKLHGRVGYWNHHGRTFRELYLDTVIGQRAKTRRW